MASFSDSSFAMIPLRVNVASHEHSIRIVDSFLWDPSVWPVHAAKSHSHTPEEAAQAVAERVAPALAQQLLSDLEVQGMGRTVRHFTGRLELWSKPLELQIQKQLEKQIQAGLLVPLTQQMQAPRKRRRAGNHADSSDSGTEKKPRTSQQSEAQVATTTSGGVDSMDVSGERKMDMIPIKLRMSVHGVRIHDDFHWDASLYDVFGPFDMARCIGEDLKLADEAIQAIAFEIIEQVNAYMLQSPQSQQIQPESSVYWSEEANNPQLSSARPDETTAAWQLEPRTHVNHIAYLVSQQKP